jgi:hypothetical protein
MRFCLRIFRSRLSELEAITDTYATLAHTTDTLLLLFSLRTQFTVGYPIYFIRVTQIIAITQPFTSI